MFVRSVYISWKVGLLRTTSIKCIEKKTVRSKKRTKNKIEVEAEKKKETLDR